MLKIDDRITYYALGGEYRTVTVETVDDAIKNGKPGFTGRTDDGRNVWGYDDQITDYDTRGTA